MLARSLPLSPDIGGWLPTRFALILVAYVVTGYLGLHINVVNAFATLAWPPAGIAFAVFLIYDYRMWPAIFLGAFLINVSIGSPLLVALCIAFGNTIGPLVGAVFVKWYNDYGPGALRLRDNVIIIFCALLIPVITATVGVGSLWAGGAIPPAALAQTWSIWWMGDMLGVLVVGPFILKWGARPLFERTTFQYIELFVMSGVVALFTYFIFWWSFTPFAYGLFVPLTWIALRTGPRGITLALLLVCAIAIPGTIAGYGPFAVLGSTQLQIFLATTSAVFLIFTAVVEERKESLKTLKRHVDELEVALRKISSEDEAKKEFLAMLAHELRNPLATILSSIELIGLQGFSALSTKTLLDTIVERSHAMVHILDDLLDISRISQKKFSLQKEVLSVHELIEKFSLTMQPFIAKSTHTFSITKPEQDLFLHADPVRLEQIFTNLIVNAIKYTKGPGSIDIVIEREGDMLATRIRDSGIGIPTHMLRRIFEPFFQINKNSSGNSEGLGIGLPLTRQLVEMHGGTIEAKSGGANAGSEFIVRLPLHSEMPTAQQARPETLTLQEQPRAPRKVRTQYKILVVDDNVGATEALARLLSLRGHDVTIAHTGLEAVQKASEFAPEIVLLDIGLPDIDGYEVARKLQEHHTTYFLIALTGYGQDEDKKRAAQAGFHHHLTKPTSFKEVEATIRKAPHILKNRREPPE